ncbi:galactose metabolism-related protein [Saitoella coloradoensis]
MDLGGNAGGFGGGYPSDWMNMMRGSALAGSAVTEDVHGMILPPDSRRASYVSSTVDDDDDTSIDANLQEDGNTVPTFIKWSGSRAHKVSVIGTFNNWRINIPLTKSVHDFSTVIHLPPGAHRLKFLVDDEWKLSNELQTATDSSGNLLNYIEVTQKDLNAVRNAGKQPSDQLHKPRRPRKEKYTSDIPAFFQEAFDASQRAAAEADASPEPSSPPATTTTHTESISQGSPSSSHSSITSEQDADPTPPSLPPHLEKVILNTNSYLKEDASVLPNPNHVVLNHLAASSIKNNVLATSATVRYHRKYVTTILYKPVELPAMD